MNVLSSFSGISVNDLEKAKNFYKSILKLELEDEMMGLRFKLPGGGNLFIYEKSDHVPAAYTFLNFVVDDINSSVDELVSGGVVMEVYDNMLMPQDERGIARGIQANQGPDIAWFKDPAGNIISLLQTDKP